LTKGDLGGFKNHQWEGIFGKRYNARLQSKAGTGFPACAAAGFPVKIHP